MWNSGAAMIDLPALDAGPLLRRGAGRPEVAAVASAARPWAGRSSPTCRAPSRLPPASCRPASKGRDRAGCRVCSIATVGTSARDQRRALGVGDGELDGRVLHDVRHRLARQLVVDADRDQACRHGRHVEHEIVGAVGRDDGDRLAALESALQQAARQGGDAPATLAVGQAELLVAVGRELDDEGRGRPAPCGSRMAARFLRLMVSYDCPTPGRLCKRRA